MNYTNLILFVFLLYWLLVMFLDRQGILSRYNISAYGPILMLRTTKAQMFLDRLAHAKRFWRMFASVGIPAMLIGMLVMFLLILYIDYTLIRSFMAQTVPQPGKFNELRNIFLIPGINEYIPLVWGIVALIITLIVHEFSHAILCKVEGIRVKSMGILLALIPIGGFAEPDEEQLLGKKAKKEDALPKKIATRSERVRVLTAGVMANFVTAFIAFVLFFSLLSYIAPIGNVMVTSVVPGSPAEIAGVKPNMILTGINDRQVSNAHDFLFYARTLETGSNVTLDLVEYGVRKKIYLVASGTNETRAGVGVFRVTKGSPAERAGIKEGMVIVGIDDTEIKNIDDFINFMNSTKEGQKVNVYLLSNTSMNATLQVFNIELSRYPKTGIEKGFLGVSCSPESATSYSIGMSVGHFQADEYLNMLKSIPSLMTGLTGWVLLFSLPIFGLAGEGFPGFSGMVINFYEPTGATAFLGTRVFWILNILLWTGWMNFYVGLFNCLPAVPLDGGHVFRDVMDSILSKIIRNGEKVERLSGTIAILFAVLILMSLVFVVIAPYAVHGF